MDLLGTLPMYKVHNRGAEHDAQFSERSVRHWCAQLTLDVVDGSVNCDSSDAANGACVRSRSGEHPGCAERLG